MKHFFIALLFTTLFMEGFAQTDTGNVVKKAIVKKHAHYLSINGTFFLQQFFNFTTSTAVITPSPYIIEYKYLPGHHGFRFDAGGSFSLNKSTQDSSQETITNTTAFNFRAGYIYQRNITKRWSFYTGVDVISVISTGLIRNNTTEDIVTTTDNAYTIGFGPSLGIQFAINNRIGLFTETGLYYQYVLSTNDMTSINFPETNSNTGSKENDLKFIIPTSLFFYIRL